MSTAFHIRQMTLADLELAVRWAAQEGWNPGRHDAACYYQSDPQGFLLGLLGDEPVATLSAVRYGSDFGFVGYFIVKPGYRVKGYGWQLCQEALSYLAGRTIGQDGVLAQQANYQKFGFEIAYRHLRQAGVSPGPAAPDASIVPLATVPMAELLAYEQPFFPAPRPAFLAAWISQPGSVALGRRRQGRLVGYGVIRRSQVGCKVAPLHADTPEDAEALFRALIGQVPAGEAIFLDTPSANPAALALATRHGLKLSFETARMYKGPAPKLPVDRVFGLTSMEIG